MPTTTNGHKIFVKEKVFIENKLHIKGSKMVVCASNKIKKGNRRVPAPTSQETPYEKQVGSAQMQ